MEEMSNSRDRQLLMELERFPILFTRAHVTPFSRHWLNVACGVLFPLGCIIWFRMWRFRLRLMGDIRQIIKPVRRLRSRWPAWRPKWKDAEKIRMIRAQAVPL